MSMADIHLSEQKVICHLNVFWSILQMVGSALSKPEQIISAGSNRYSLKAHAAVKTVKTTLFIRARSLTIHLVQQGNT